MKKSYTKRIVLIFIFSFVLFSLKSTVIFATDEVDYMWSGMYDNMTQEERDKLQAENEKKIQAIVDEKSVSDKNTLKQGKGDLIHKIFWFMGVVIYGIAYCVGMLATWMLGFLTEVAQYNNFINATAVTVGWVVVRDICNMFFVLILLMIAFGTILRRESYSVKALLPKLVIMAVLINFSKTICGLIIDFSQVIMLTFVAGFANGSAGNMVKNLGMDKILGFSSGTEGSLNSPEIEKNLSLEAVGGLFLGLICMIVILVIIIAMIVTLIARIVMLWIYTIMSPIAYFGAAFPAGQKYASQWWSEFSKNVIVGPVLAFFLYLAIVTSSKSADVITSEVKSPASMGSFSMSSFLNGSTFSTYLITLGLLIGGMMVAQSVGASSGGAIGKGMAALNKGKGLAWKGTKGIADWANRKQAKNLTGIDLNPKRFVENIKAEMAQRKSEDLSRIDAKAAQNLRKGGIMGGLTGLTSKDWAENYFGLRGVKMAFRGSVKGIDDKEKDIKTKEEEKKKSINDKIGQLESYWQRLDSTNRNGSNDVQIQKTMDEIKKLEEERDKPSQELKNLDARRTKYMITDWRSKQSERSAFSEQMKKIDSTNEDELIAQFEQACAKKNTILAGALSQKIAKVGGMNTLLNKNGYQSSPGLSEDEAKAMSQKDYEKEKGFKDFMRDMFIKKLGMTEQSMLAMQNDIASLAEDNSHAYMRKSVNIKNGRFYQTDREDQKRAILIEESKKEGESMLRKGNRFEYGFEDLNTNRFRWTEEGLTKFISKLDLIFKETGSGGRFNDNAAAKISMSPDATDQLRKAIVEGIGSGSIKSTKNFPIDDSKSPEETAEIFMKQFVSFGKNKSISNDPDSKMVDIIKKAINT